MDKKAKEEMTKLVTDVLNDVVIPAMEEMEERLASKNDLHELEMKVDSLDRKFDAAQNRLDNHDKRISTLEKILDVTTN